MTETETRREAAEGERHETAIATVPDDGRRPLTQKPQ